MTTAPAGWRERAHEAQRVALVLVARASQVLRRGREAAAEHYAVISAAARVRFREYERLARQRLREALARRAAATDPRLALGAHVVTQPGDDVATILGRIDAAGDADVVLVVPRGVASLRTPAAWARLAGHARRRGLHLKVVAARSEVRDYARQTGLPAARTWHGLPGARVPLRLGDFVIPISLPRLGESMWPQALGLAALIAIFFGILAYSVPGASIDVTPPSEPIEEHVRVRVNPLAGNIDPTTRTMPATTVHRTVKVVVSGPTTGTTWVGDRPAGARLEFTNEGQARVDLPAGTVARSDSGVAFATVGPLSLEPGQRASVDAIAQRPGTAGNVPAGAIRAGDLPAGVRVSNPQAARGGTDRPTPGVTQADVDRVSGMATEVIARTATHQLEQEFEDGMVFPETISIAVLGQRPYYDLEEPSSVFVAEYTAQVSVLAVPPETALSFAERYLETRIGANSRLVPGRTRVTFESEPVLEGGQLTADVRISGAVTKDFDARALASEVAGMTPASAAEHVRERLALDQPPRVSLQPAWLPWPWMPRDAGRIEVHIVSPPPETAARPEQ